MPSSRRPQKSSASKASLKPISAPDPTISYGNESPIQISSNAEKPSTMQHGDLYVVRVYTDESIDGHVYTHAKHVWYKNHGRTLCICHFYEDGTYRFVEWNADRVVWYQVVPERFEEERNAAAAKQSENA